MTSVFLTFDFVGASSDRGKRNLDAMLGFLKETHGLTEAQEVLLSGGSAGGLSTYLHADYVRSQFATEVKFKAAPISGVIKAVDQQKIK